MRFALINGQRQEAQPRLRGTCPACGDQMVARCGNVRIKHWAHLGKLVCDPWWEETPWHRAWKGLFPVEWQEFVQHAPSGEKHIADVRTDRGYVLEFQHSPLDPLERQTREAFYQQMIWIVDGTRRSRDKSQLLRAVEGATTINPTVWRLRGFWDECALLRDWQGSGVQVVFDFGEDDLWFIFSANGAVYIATFPRAGFIEFHRTGSGAFAQFYPNLVQAVTADIAKLRARALVDQQRARTLVATGFQRYMAWRQRSRRRF
jgi:competence protein CoiA